jgi:hypothetical protein
MVVVLIMKVLLAGRVRSVTERGVKMSTEYPNPCCRCGLCCLAETCIVARANFNIQKNDPCPALSFNADGIATCGLVAYNLVPIGDGCCIKARAYKDGIEYNFSDLPSELKFRAVRDMKKHAS